MPLLLQASAGRPVRRARGTGGSPRKHDEDFAHFGLVLLESLSCGVPVAAYPVPGPLDVIGDAPVGVLHEDLREACLRALTIERNACRAFANCMTWDRCVRMFLDNLAVLRRGAEAPERRRAPAVSRARKALKTT